MCPDFVQLKTMHDSPTYVYLNLLVARTHTDKMDESSRLGVAAKKWGRMPKDCVPGTLQGLAAHNPWLVLAWLRTRRKGPRCFRA